MKDVLGLISKNPNPPSVCESCGDEVACGAAINECWCFDINLSDQNRAELKSKFEKCLCKDCLEIYKSKDS